MTDWKWRMFRPLGTTKVESNLPKRKVFWPAPQSFAKFRFNTGPSVKGRKCVAPCSFNALWDIDSASSLWRRTLWNRKICPYFLTQYLRKLPFNGLDAHVYCESELQHSLNGRMRRRLSLQLEISIESRLEHLAVPTNSVGTAKRLILHDDDDSDPLDSRKPGILQAPKSRRTLQTTSSIQARGALYHYSDLSSAARPLRDFD